MTLKATDVTGVLRCKVAVCGGCSWSRMARACPCNMRVQASMPCPCPGECAVGKSALISMFTSKGRKFPKDYNLVGWEGALACSFLHLMCPCILAGGTLNSSRIHLLQTAGVEVVVAQVPVPDTTMIAELYLMDTSGSDLYKEALPQYWNGVYYALLVFDVTSPESYDSCKLWAEELKKAR
jgi:transport family protein 27